MSKFKVGDHVETSRNIYEIVGVGQEGYSKDTFVLFDGVITIGMSPENLTSRYFQLATEPRSTKDITINIPDKAYKALSDDLKFTNELREEYGPCSSSEPTLNKIIAEKILPMYTSELVGRHLNTRIKSDISISDDRINRLDLKISSKMSRLLQEDAERTGHTIEELVEMILVHYDIEFSEGRNYHRPNFDDVRRRPDKKIVTMENLSNTEIKVATKYLAVQIKDHILEKYENAELGGGRYPVITLDNISKDDVDFLHYLEEEYSNVRIVYRKDVLHFLVLNPSNHDLVDARVTIVNDDYTAATKIRGLEV